MIKSYVPDDIHKSIKYNIWSSTKHGNKRLDEAYKESAIDGPIYLFFSVNSSGCFCGIAQMVSPVDYSKSFHVWAQNDTWVGVLNVKWIFIKDVPNKSLNHITVSNNRKMPVTVSRDTQEIFREPGLEMLKIFHSSQHRSSIMYHFDDYNRIEKDRIGTKPTSKYKPGNEYARRQTQHRSTANYRQRISPGVNKIGEVLNPKTSRSTFGVWMSGSQNVRQRSRQQYPRKYVGRPRVVMGESIWRQRNRTVKKICDVGFNEKSKNKTVARNISVLGPRPSVPTKFFSDSKHDDSNSSKWQSRERDFDSNWRKGNKVYVVNDNNFWA